MGLILPWCASFSTAGSGTPFWSTCNAGTRCGLKAHRSLADGKPRSAQAASLTSTIAEAVRATHKTVADRIGRKLLSKGKLTFERQRPETCLWDQRPTLT